MATITSAGSGAFDNGGSWVGGVAPTLGDNAVIANGHTITMDQAATIDLGNDSATAAINIQTGGKLQYLYTASNDLVMQLKGDLVVGGTLEIGTSVNAIPQSRHVTIKLNNSGSLADGKYGLKANAGSVVNIYGATKNILNTLSADAAANATSIGFGNSPTNWQNNDEIALAPTTRTSTQFEKITVGSIVGSTVNVGVGGGSGGNSLLNAHGGGSVANVVAEVINLTQNILITSFSTTAGGFITIATTCVWNSRYTEFSYLGANATNQKGLDIQTTTGTCNIQNCTIHDSRYAGVLIASPSGTGVTFSNNGLYNLNTQAAALNAFQINTSTGTVTASGNYLIGVTGAGVSLGGNNLVMNGLNVSGVSGGGLTFSIAMNSTLSFSNINVHSCGAIGITVSTSGGANYLWTNIKSWRNGSYGLQHQGNHKSFTIDGLTLFGNTTANWYVIATLDVIDATIVNASIQGDATYSTGIGIRMMQFNPTLFTANIFNSAFGNIVAHTTNDFLLTNAGGDYVQINSFNTIWTEANPMGISANQINYIRSNRHNNSATTHKSMYGTGLVEADQTTRHTASDFSWKMTPNSSSMKLIFPGPNKNDTMRAAANANVPITIAVWILYNGTYNGALPRLVIPGGLVPGVGTVLVNNTAVAGAGLASTWQQLSLTVTPTEAGVIEFYIDCDGTAGSVFVDDVSISQ